MPRPVFRRCVARNVLILSVLLARPEGPWFLGAAFLADHFRNIKDPENVLVSRDLWFDNLPAVMRVRITTPNLGAVGGIYSVEGDRCKDCHNRAIVPRKPVGFCSN